MRTARFRVLGPLNVVDDERDFTPSAHKQRQLLSLLLLNANQVVSTTACIDELWDEDPPQSAGATLQTYVLQLRRRLAVLPSVGSVAAAKSVLVTQVHGYQMSIDPAALDLTEFTAMASRGRMALARDDAACAAVFFRRALATWQGEPLADVQAGRRIRTWTAGLREQWLGVLEQRIEADLRLGRHHELISELSSLITEHGTHENFHAQLMLALYRSGRQAHALEVMARLRARLAGELGLEPSPRMKQLHQAVLSSNPKLDPTAVASASPLSLDLFSDLLGEPLLALPDLEECCN